MATAEDEVAAANEVKAKVQAEEKAAAAAVSVGGKEGQNSAAMAEAAMAEATSAVPAAAGVPEAAEAAEADRTAGANTAVCEGEEVYPIAIAKLRLQWNSVHSDS